MFLEFAVISVSMDTPPTLFAKVRLWQRADLYQVVDVNLNEDSVEVVSLTRPRDHFEVVPFGAIREVIEEPPEEVFRRPAGKRVCE
jgi:hypothetical protein